MIVKWLLKPTKLLDRCLLPQMGCADEENIILSQIIHVGDCIPCDYFCISDGEMQLFAEINIHLALVARLMK